ncbi:MAG: DUF2079 domain-containing protein [Candidatus Desulfofervidaceae bacterium]|nr:DUF2079 domain-containing protein [Candidatus Desulfofervidaceae bacterium]
MEFLCPASVPIDPKIAVTRYFIIPLLGLSIGAMVFLLLLLSNTTESYIKQLNIFFDKYGRKLLLYGGIIYCLFILFLALARYFTLHLDMFDFGVYDTKIWQISQASWANKFKIASTGHFQPILVIFSFIYNVFDCPWILLLIQVIFTLSGAIPLYLICKKNIKNSLFVVGIVSLYLLYPPVTFNALFDFHPDHLYIPLLLWVFYFISQDKYLKSIPFLILSCTLKEPFILGIAFIGIYLAWAKKKYSLGLLIFLICLFLFYEITFVLLGHENSKTVLETKAFAYIGSSPLFILENLHEIITQILSPAKLRFPFFIFYPFLFLPLLCPKELISALPFLIIPLVSKDPYHQNVASHYTAGIVPPVFMAVISLYMWIINKKGSKVSFALLIWMFIGTITLNIAHSPLPLSVAFWNKRWSQGKWHYSNYLWTEHEKKLKEAIDTIPDNPEIKIVAHSGIYHKRLAHRYFYKPFPQDWQKADYIILDHSRGFILGDRLVKEKEYFASIHRLQDSHLFKLLYDKGQIQVYGRITSKGKLE